MCRQHTAPAAWYRCSYVLTHTRQKNFSQIVNLGRVFSLSGTHYIFLYIDVHRLRRIISNPQVDQPVNMHSYQTVMEWDITKVAAVSHMTWHVCLRILMISTVAYDTELIQPSYDQIETMTFSHLHGEVYKGSYDERLRPIRTRVRQLEHWLKVRPWKLSVCKAHYYR